MLKTATKLLERGRPIPLDLFTRLLNAGVDVAALERKIRRRRRTVH
jgi:hypothetical protein